MTFSSNLRWCGILTVLLSLFWFSSSCTSPDSNEQVKVLQGATLFDGTGSDAIENGVLVIRDGEIDCVGSKGDCELPTGAEIIDVTGKYITPGLIDAHMHFFQTGFFDSRPDALDLRDTYPFSKVAAYQKQHPQRYYDAYLCSGVTGVYDVGGFTWSIDFQQETEDNPNAPHVAAAGPLITPASGAPFDLPPDRALVNLDSKETGIQTVQYLSALGSTGIKLWQLDANDEEYMQRVEAVAEETRKEGNQLIAHATSLNQAKAALQNGTKLLVHSVSDQEVDEEFIELAKENNTIYNPTLIVSGGYMQAYRAAADVASFDINDLNGCVDTKTRERLRSADQFKNHEQFSDSFLDRLESFDPQADLTNETDMKNLKKVYEAGIPIAVGTDAGNPGTLHGISVYEEMEAMQEAGIPAEDLIVMATQNGAKAMQREDEIGTLESGKIADLVVLDEDPSVDIENMRTIEQVMRKGELRSVKEIGEDK